MLKIKDNVDLKELEKFGFEIPKTYSESSNRATKYELVDTIATIQTKNTFVELYSNGIIYINSVGDMSSYDLDYLYNLIKADLVEKVE